MKKYCSKEFNLSNPTQYLLLINNLQTKFICKFYFIYKIEIIFFNLPSLSKSKNNICFLKEKCL